MSDCLNPAEVAAATGLSLTTVYRALESGELPGSKIRGRWVTLRSQLDERLRDGRTPTPRERRGDPMPKARHPRRQRGSFRSRVVDLEARRSRS